MCSTECLLPCLQGVSPYGAPRAAGAPQANGQPQPKAPPYSRPAQPQAPAGAHQGVTGAHTRPAVSRPAGSTHVPQPSGSYSTGAPGARPAGHGPPGVRPAAPAQPHVHPVSAAAPAARPQVRPCRPGSVHIRPHKQSKAYAILGRTHTAAALHVHPCSTALPYCSQLSTSLWLSQGWCSCM